MPLYDASAGNAVSTSLNSFSNSSALLTMSDKFHLYFLSTSFLVIKHLFDFIVLRPSVKIPPYVIQFLLACMGGGITPPRLTNTSGAPPFTAMTGAVPNSPPKFTSSPTVLP